ncbi:MAG: polysaccharide deacetylase family protein [Candidatus Saccharimonas aalborgensis]
MRRRARRVRFPWALVIIVSIISGTALFFVVSWLRPVTEAINEQYFWVDARYEGVKSKVTSASSRHITMMVEYPEMDNKTITASVRSYLDERKTQFLRDVEGARMIVPRPMSKLNATYQLTNKGTDTISILIQSRSEVGGSSPRTDVRAWTFDLKTGKEITLRDLYGQKSTDGIARTKLYLKQKLMARLEVTNEYDDRLVNKVFDSPSFGSFVITNPHTIQFSFGQGVIASEAAGAIDVSLPIDNLQLFLQTDQARKLLDIVSIDQIPEYQPLKNGEVDCSKLKCIALTFDDGPSNYTSQILDALQRYHAHASFFVIGQNIDKHRDVLKRASDAGNTIGNHSWGHPSLSYLTPARINDELIKTNNSIKQVTGKDTPYMRPPNGAINHTVYTMLAERKMTAIMWSVDTRDWADRNTDIVYNRVIAGAKPGAIIVLHDIHQTSVAAVPRILETLTKQGYVFVSIEQLFGPSGSPGKSIYSAN